MPPESAESKLSILQESMRIKDALLPLQEKLTVNFDESQRTAFNSIRQQLGYTNPDSVDFDSLVDTRILDKVTVVSPDAVEAVLPPTKQSTKTTLESRKFVEDILLGDDDRIFVVIGPCSVHDPEAVLEYAHFVRDMREKYGEDLEIIMRLYAEKPRTELGWKGFIHDPLLDGSEDMNLGLIADRMIALRITDMGVPLGRERLGPNTPQYVNGLITYDSVGARNTQDQNARMYASGTSSPDGIKNGTDGNIDTAISACVAANGAHSFVGIDSSGQQAIVMTKGNNLAHVILRGGDKGPNFDPETADLAISKIRAKNDELGIKIIEGVVLDASHKNKVGNSQAEAIMSVVSQIQTGSTAIRGVLIESFLKEGNQKLDPANITALEYGKSITDYCANTDQTEEFLSMLAGAVSTRRASLSQSS